MKFIPYDDYQSMALFGMPITLVECGDDWSTMDDIFIYSKPLVEVFRYGDFDNVVYDLTRFTHEHVDIAIQIGEQLAKHLALNLRSCCPYYLHYNECYAVITRNRVFKRKNKAVDLFLIESPVILFEILPPKATKMVRTNKFDLHRYHRCPTLEVSLLLSQDEPYVEMYRKAIDWKQECISGNASIMLDLLKVELPLVSIYEGVF